jgi:hypothetical protein
MYYALSFTFKVSSSVIGCRVDLLRSIYLTDWTMTIEELFIKITLLTTSYFVGELNSKEHEKYDGLSVFLIAFSCELL